MTKRTKDMEEDSVQGGEFPEKHIRNVDRRALGVKAATWAAGAHDRGRRSEDEQNREAWIEKRPGSVPEEMRGGTVVGDGRKRKRESEEQQGAARSSGGRPPWRMGGEGVRRCSG